MRPVHYACLAADMEMCKLLDIFKCNWESLDEEEQTPIFQAVNGNSLAVVKFLVEEKKVNHEY